MRTEERLLHFKEQIDTAKTQQAEVKGQITAVEGQMDSQFNVKDIPSAEKKHKKINTSLEVYNAQFSKGMQELEEAHEWE